MSEITKLHACRICGNEHLETVLDLGVQVLTGRFPKDPTDALAKGPLVLVRCAGDERVCGLVQLAHTYDLGEMYGDQYGYRSGLNASMVRHLASKVQSLLRQRPLDAGDLVLDIGSNDGTTLGQYPETATRLGIDPTTEKFRKFHAPGITAIADFFSAATFRARMGDRKARIVTSISMFYDLPAPMDFVRDVAAVLADDGIWHLEQSYLPLMLETNSYDTVCHEHLEYYSLRQLRWMTSRAGLRIIDVQLNDVNGGSFAVTVEKGEGDSPIVAELLAREAFLDAPETWPAFRRRVERQREALVETLQALKAEGKRVFGLGASTKGNVVLQYCGITSELLTAVAEVNPDKFGSFTPGTHVPIVSETDALESAPDVFLVLPWHFRSLFLKSQRPFLERGGALLFPLPDVEIVHA